MLRLDGVSKDYPAARGAGWLSKNRTVRVLNDVFLEVGPAETVAVVGESGSGKSTLLRLAIGIERPTSGRVYFKEKSMTKFTDEDWHGFRSSVQPVFQDPWGALNPRLSAGEIVAEPLRCLLRLSRAVARDRAAESFASVGLDISMLDRYPQEFSGGQRQRIAIARALALRPQLVTLDEPVSALDVSVRAQIVNLLKELQASHKLAYLLVSHDMPTVWSLSDRVIVLYRGSVMEAGPTQAIRASARSPYTRRLLESLLPDDPRHKLQGGTRPTLSSNVAAEAVRAGGCPFQSACALVMEACRAETPPLRSVAPGHMVACHHPSSFEIGGSPVVSH